MKISDNVQYWQQITARTLARNSNGAPSSVQMQVAALVGDHGLTLPSVATPQKHRARGPSLPSPMTAA